MQNFRILKSFIYTEEVCEMSQLSLNKQYKLFSLALSLGMMTIAVKPSIAQDLKVKETSSSQINVASLPSSAKVSTEATDLLLPAIEQQKIFTNVKNKTYQIGQLDLEKFCQNYPYNSKCKGNTPGLETDPSSAPVPISPPASREEDSSSKGEPRSGWAIVPEISTLGLGGHVVRKITPQINGRAGINLFKLGFNIEDDSSEVNTNYEVDLNLLNVSTLVDFHPMKKSGFRLTSGLVFNNNNVEGTATTNEEIEIGDQTFTADQVGSVDADIEVTRSVAPYLGIGWGNAVAANKKLGFWFNLGVMFGGSPDIEVTPNINQNLPEAQREQIEAEVNSEIDKEEKEIEDDLAFMSIYPVGSLGISYQF
jgi:hypothetical protein